MEKCIVHVSETAIRPTTGMGRVEFHWQQAFERAGYQFIHIGPEEAGPHLHRSLFGFKAWQYFKRLKKKPSGIIVHEPASGWFVKKGIPCFLESHGVERRGWEWQLAHERKQHKASQISRRTRWLYPIWRLSACDRGIKHADRLLLINSEDRDFVTSRYHRLQKDIFLFRNGIQPAKELNVNRNDSGFTILFNGTWIERKGIHTLVRAAQLLHDMQLDIHYLLIGTGKDEASVLNDWPADLHRKIQVVPTFRASEENSFIYQADLFVLPSYMEGQPLSLLQAMAAGKCCITTACCGQKDIIESNKTGFLFDAGDHIRLAELIRTCYENEALRDQIGLNARAYCQALHWDMVSDELAQYVISNIDQIHLQ